VNIADVALYRPIVSSGISRDGRWAVACAPAYDPEADARHTRAYVLDLDAVAAGAAPTSTWRELLPDALAVYGPTFSPDCRHLAAFQGLARGQSLEVFDLLDLDAPPTSITGLPYHAAALKWDAKGRLTCLGDDAEGVRRVWRWKDLDAPPAPVTPPDEAVLDYSFGRRPDDLVWLAVPPVELKPGPVSPVMRWQRGEPTDEARGGSIETLEIPVFLFGYLCHDATGERLAFIGRDPSSQLATPHVWVLDPARWCHDGGGLACISGHLDGDVKGYDWLPDGAGLIVAMQQHTTGRLLRFDFAPGAVPSEPLEARTWGGDPGYLSGPHVDREGGRVLYLHQDSHVPQRMMLGALDAPEAPGVALTHFSDALAELPLAPSRHVEWLADDGLRIEGVYIAALRPDANDANDTDDADDADDAASNGSGEVDEAAVPAPTIIWLHGGPAEHVAHTFSPYFQVFAAAGYNVFAPNYRGSTGRGDAFLRASVGGLCRADRDDVRAGIAHLAAEGLVTPGAIGVIGWSYGATLALALAASGEAIEALVVGAPVIDLVNVFGAPRYPSTMVEYFAAPWWQDRTPYDAASPITYGERLEAPTLILHGEDDPRIPKSQSLLLYRMLLAREVPTSLQYFAREGHIFTHPKSVRQMLGFALDWLDGYLFEPPDEPGADEAAASLGGAGAEPPALPMESP
jgi:dipeptidyl aminopeptidase/acylaminoacyl peptidase